MSIRYIGRAFREQHHITQRALAQGARVRAATLVDLEHGRRAPNLATVERIAAYFHTRGLPCALTDLLILDNTPPAEDADGRRDSAA